ncbi:hypothetical protein [Actinomadura sp. 7K507]|uniref:hypothetical protein n=1 Tax=Actinomadura sp. 7K507 TaxID=2530365 RepID=UPI0010507B16|nr:hypothetical protein [Actinomadura sp. 7K507]TDC83612.1 hypothetical protein E1285_28485 [Actinomadura sp. 7K507]
MSDENGVRHLKAVRDDAGNVTLEGHDIGKGVSDFYGPAITEYEWAHRIAAADVARLLTALGGRTGDDILDLLPTGPEADVYGLLAEHQITYTAIFSRHGD